MIANLRYAARSGEKVWIGGGQFSGRELTEVADKLEAADDMLEVLKMLFGSNALHSVCRHAGEDAFGRVKGTWSSIAEEKARAAIAKAEGK